MGSESHPTSLIASPLCPLRDMCHLQLGPPAPGRASSGLGLRGRCSWPRTVWEPWALPLHSPSPEPPTNAWPPVHFETCFSLLVVKVGAGSCLQCVNCLGEPPSGTAFAAQVKERARKKQPLFQQEAGLVLPFESTCSGVRM